MLKIYKSTIDVILLIIILITSNFHQAWPEHGISVLLKSGLTNFSGCTVLASQLASKENGVALMNAIENYMKK